jgi:cyclopropane-fatty-acyl-phospholipid synthase
VSSAVERQGLLTSDIEILRLHYAQTLKLWRERFRRHWTEAASLYDERFCRMWDYYLAGAECGFRILNQMVFQFQLSKKQGLLPATRDYIVRAEAALRTRELERAKPLLAAE